MFIGQSCLAQFPAFFIDLYFGDVQVIKPGKKATPVKSRMFLYPEDILLIKNEGGNATLVNKDYQYTVLSKKGSYKLSEISKLPVSKPKGITQKYFELLWEELLNPGSISRDEKVKKIAGSWGGIIRGICNLKETPEENTVSAENWITFNWPSFDGTTKYRFSIFDKNSEMLYQFIIRDTTITINRKNFVKESVNTFYWQAESEEAPDNKTCKNKLNWLTPEEYRKQSELLIKSIQGNYNLNYNLEVSNKLFENGFYKLALGYFEKSLAD